MLRRLAPVCCLALLGPLLLNLPAAEAAPAPWAVCRPGPGLAECLLRREPVLLDQRQGAVVAHRTGDVLSLQQAGRPVLSFTDQESLRHVLAGSLGEGSAWLIARLPAAGLPSWLLVVPATGWQLPLQEPPQPAPAGHLMVAVEPGAAGQGGRVSLLQRAGARWSLAFRYEAPAGLHLEWRHWRDDGAAIFLRWEREARADCPEHQGQVQLRDGPYGWDFVPPLPDGCPAD